MRVQISHLKKKEIRQRILEKLNHFGERFEKAFGIQEIDLDVDIHKTRKYSFHAKMKCSLGTITAKASAFKWEEALKEVIDKLERQAMKAKAQVFKVKKER